MVLGAIFGKKGYRPEQLTGAETMMNQDAMAAQFAQDPTGFENFLTTWDGRKAMEKAGFKNNPTGYMNYLQSQAQRFATPQQFAGIEQGLMDSEAMQTEGFGDLLRQLSGYDGKLDNNWQDFTYNMRDVSMIPDQVYQDMLDMENEQASRGFKGALTALSNQYGSRGFKPGSGFEQSKGTSMGRNYLEQLSNISRGVSGQKAQAKMDLEKFMTQQDLYRQQLQDQSNQARAGYMTDLQKYFQNFGLQQNQQAANLMNQRFQNQQMAGMNRGQTLQGQQQMALTPYNMNLGYYQTAISKAPQGSKGIFGDILKAGTSIAGKAMGGV